MSVYASIGYAHSIASGRLSFCLGLHGPCESVDTACSSALVAAHAAQHGLLLDGGGRHEASNTPNPHLPSLFLSSLSLSHAHASLAHQHTHTRM